MRPVRDAVPADARAVAEVHVRSWQAAYRGLIADELLDALRPEQRMPRYTFGSSDPTDPHTTLAIDADVVVGFATTGPCRDPDLVASGELLAIYVDPDAWSLGVGRVLMREARARLAAAGFRDAVLWVLVGNARAERFYVADGWTPDGHTRREDVWGVDVTVRRYRTPLDATVPYDPVHGLRRRPGGPHT